MTEHIAPATAPEAAHIAPGPAADAAHVAPGTAQEAAHFLRQSPTAAVVVRGAGTKDGWGNPPRRLDVMLETGNLTGVVEHAAGDMVAVVRAGTPMAALQEVLARNGQQLAIDTPMAAATVGGVVAANVSGPRRLAYGTIRDLLIGITIVRPDGVIAHSGGRVVKNVAGYDLGKLFTGSFGTLGLITECVFRLHPLPASSVAIHGNVTDLAALLAALRHSQLMPSAIEIDAPAPNPTPSAAAANPATPGVGFVRGAGFVPGADAAMPGVGLVPGAGEVVPGVGLVTGIGMVHDGDFRPEVGLLFEGAAAAARAEQAAKLFDGPVVEGFPPWWNTYPWKAGETGMKVSVPLSKVATLLEAGVHLRGSAGVGVLYAALPAELSGDLRAALPEERSGHERAAKPAEWSGDVRQALTAERAAHLRAAAKAAGGFATVVTSPYRLEEHPVAGIELMRRIKEQFDPGARFAPGRFVGGI